MGFLTKIGALGALALIVVAAPVAAQTTSLADALAQAYQTNPQLSGQQAVVRSTDEGVIAARAALLPTLSQTQSLSDGNDLGNTVGGSPRSNLSVTTTVGIQLYDGGADRLRTQSARMDVLAARQQLKVVEQNVLFSTVQAYMNIRRDQQFVRLARSNVKVLREQVRAAKDRFEVGEVTRTDVSQAEARLAFALSTVEANLGNLRRSENAYAAVVGSRPGRLRNPPPAPKLPASVEAAETVAIKRHPRIMQAQFSAKAAEIGLQAVKKNRHPTITGSVAHTLSGRPNNGRGHSTNAVNGQISGNLPIYQGGALDSARRGASARLDQALSNVQLAGYTTRQALRNAYATWQVASASITSNRQQVRAAQVAFEGVTEEAKLGARTTLDALDAEQELLNARSQLVTAIHDQYVATYSVLSEMGLLTAEHLNLGVALYNPDDYTAKVTKKQLSPLGTKRLKLFDKLKKRKGG